MLTRVDRPFFLLAAWLLALACFFVAPLRAVAMITPTQKTASGFFAEPSSGRPDAQASANQECIRAERLYAYELASGRTNWLNRDPMGEDGGWNLYGFVSNNPVISMDLMGLSILSCMGDCVQANDPLELISQKVLLSLSGMKLPKTFVVKLAEIAGDKQLARLLQQSLRVPGISRVTSLPATLSAALRAPGLSSQFLHGVGAGMGPFWISYGLYMAAVEAACLGHCCGNVENEPSIGIALPININELINSAADGIAKAIGNSP